MSADEIRIHERTRDARERYEERLSGLIADREAQVAERRRATPEDR